MTKAAQTQDRLNRGLFLFAAGVFFMSVMDAAAKLLSKDYSEIQIIFFESVFGLISLTLILWRHGWRIMRTPRWYLMVGRGFLTLATMFFFFAGLKHLPLAEVTIIFLLSPILTMLLSSLLFKEHAGLLQMFAIVAGAVGAILIINPPGVGLDVAALYPLGAAITAALSLAASRALSRRDSPEAIAGYEFIVLFVAAVVLVPRGQHVPATSDLWMVAIMGASGGLTVYLRTKACASTPLSRLAPLEYTGMVWAIALGFLIWTELPEFWGWVGAALVAVGGLMATAKFTPKQTANAQ